MTLIVEDGTIVPAAESYASAADADAYHTSRGNAGWAGTTDAKESALRRAADYLQSVYHGAWRGWRTDSGQSLDWPRQLVPIDDAPFTPSYINMHTIPPEVKRAQMLLALYALTADLNPNLTRATKSETVGDIAVVYDDASPEGTRYNAVDAMLSKLIHGSGIMVKLER